MRISAPLLLQTKRAESVKISSKHRSIGFIELFCFKKSFLIHSLVSRNLKLKYRGSFLGFFWSLLVPLFVSMTYIFVFQYIIKIQIPNYGAFIIAGVLPWTFFAQTILDGMEGVTRNHVILSKVALPFYVFPLASAITSLINFVLSIPVIIGVALVMGSPLSLTYLLIPLAIVLLFTIAYFVALILSVILVYFRDLRPLMEVIMQVWMYASPILYPASMVPENLQWVMYANPIIAPLMILKKAVLVGEVAGLHYWIAAPCWVFVLYFLARAIVSKNVRAIVEKL